MPAFSWVPGAATTIKVAGPKLAGYEQGHELECVCFGPSPSQAPTIVLLHEGLGCVDLWRSFPKALAAATECGVFVFSRAGYGGSSPVQLPRPLDYMSVEATEVLPQLLDATQVEKCILLGHSDGASIAAINAGSIADPRVRGLVLIAPHFFTEPLALTSIAQARANFESTVNTHEVNLRDALSRYHNDVDNAFYGWCDAWLDEGFKEWNIGENIEYIRVPVLAIQGADDQYGSLAQIEEIEQRCYAPVESLIIPDCRHSPHIEHSEVVLASVCEFVDRLVDQENGRTI